ncbi:MAG: hypothetical protein CMF61_05535 [Magnetococcales bacterium]|nr:hypothetical protein [Magnetococcales bacterium]|tara:strand:+ start:452 stop:820 length:369 start_codon:yes stop_codon:yes gene_type:complete
MNKRYQQPVNAIKLSPAGVYTALNSENAMRFNSLIRLMRANKMAREAQTLTNLRNARSNYLWAFSAKTKGGNHRIGAYTNSFRKAKQEAIKLYNNLLDDPNYPLLCKPTAILDYVRSECRSV